MHKENPIVADTQDCTDFAARVRPLAERELISFYQAVMFTWGADHCAEAVEDWMRELDLAEWTSNDVPLTLRRITINTIGLLVVRLGANAGRESNKTYSQGEEYDPNHRHQATLTATL